MSVRLSLIPILLACLAAFVVCVFLASLSGSPLGMPGDAFVEKHAEGLSIAVSIFKLVGIFTGALSGLLGLNVDFVDAEKNFTRWGKIALWGIVCSFFVAASGQLIEYSLDSLASRENLKEFRSVLDEIQREQFAIKSVHSEFTVWFPTPEGSSPYFQVLEGKFHNLSTMASKQPQTSCNDLSIDNVADVWDIECDADDSWAALKTDSDPLNRQPYEEGGKVASLLRSTNLLLYFVRNAKDDALIDDRENNYGALFDAAELQITIETTTLAEAQRSKFDNFVGPPPVDQIYFGLKQHMIKVWRPPSFTNDLTFVMSHEGIHSIMDLRSVRLFVRLDPSNGSRSQDEITLLKTARLKELKLAFDGWGNICFSKSDFKPVYKGATDDVFFVATFPDDLPGIRALACSI